MGFWSFLLLVIFILAGVMLYHRLQRMEREIRAELQAKDAGDEAGPEEDTLLSEQNSVVSSPSVIQAADGAEGIDSQILSAIRNEPGMMQTELYQGFPGHSRKALQDLLRKLDQDGKINRKKTKGTYQLYPV